MTFSCALFSLWMRGGVFGCIERNHQFQLAWALRASRIEKSPPEGWDDGSFGIFARPPYMQPLLVAMHLQSAKLLDVDLPAGH